MSVPALASTQQSEVILGLNSNISKNGKNIGVQGVPLPTTKPVIAIFYLFCLYLSPTFFLCQIKYRIQRSFLFLFLFITLIFQTVCFTVIRAG